MSHSVKALVLIAMGVFLYTRFYFGSILFYISERFVWLTVFAAVALVIVGLSYRYGGDHNYHHDDHDHSHSLSWAGILLIISPILLGVLIPPRPLGAAAMQNRDVGIGSLTSTQAPADSTLMSKPAHEKTILDWLVDFRVAGDPDVFEGEEAKLIGFVYRDDRFDDDRFMVSRFIVSCCAADATPLGLIVQWPESAELPSDQWVEVTGHFETGQFETEVIPIIIAESITNTDIPAQPYLYP